MRFPTKLLVLIVILSIFLGLLGPSSVFAEEISEEAPAVCQNKSGGLKTGAIDVLVLLDNSGSLIKDRTDPDGLRFQALDEFIENFSKLTTSKKNFALIKFAQNAELVVNFQELNASNGEDIEQQIRNGTTDPGGATDYIAAFDLAMYEFKKRPDDNCKILIWFTDGGYQIRKDELEKDLARLEEAFCSESGFGADAQSLDINTFVVFLGNGLSKDQNTQARNNGSIDAMQVITGDIKPAIQGGDVRAVIGEKCKAQFESIDRHLGEVVSAGEAADLLGYLTDIANIADGGTIATESQCPAIESIIETVPMPSGWYVDWISITSWDGDLKSGDSLGLKIKIDGKDQPSTQFLEPLKTKGSSNVLRFKIKEGKQNDLKPGWVLHAEGLGRVCIRVKPPEIKFRIKGDLLVPLSPGGLPVEYFSEGQLTCVSNEQQVSCFSTSDDGPVGKIEVQNGSVFNIEKILPVSFLIDDVPSLIDDRCVIELTGKHGASNNSLSTTFCDVFPAPTTTFNIMASDLLGQLDKCGLGSWSITVDGAQSTKIDAGDKPVRIAIATNAAPKNINKKCTISFAPITFRSSQIGQVSIPTIQTTIDFDLVKKANPLLAVLFATIATILVSILSLLLLRAVNMITSKTIAAEKLFGYETNLDLVPGPFKRGELSFAGGNARSFVANFDNLQQISGNAQQTSLMFGSLRLLRKLPSFVKPFEESRLVLLSRGPAVFWKSNRAKDGLNMAFAKAMILTTAETRSPAADRPTKVTVFILVPKRGLGAGVDGVEQLIRERADELAAELYKSLAFYDGDETINESQSTSSPDNLPVVRENADEASSGPILRPAPTGAPQSRATDLTVSGGGLSTIKPSQRPGPPEPPKRNI